MLPKGEGDEQRWLEEELATQRDFLRRLIQARGFSLSDLDQRFGYRRSYLSRVLKGETNLTVHHVLAILQAIGFSPAAFFSALYPPPEQDTPSEELRALVARIEKLLPETARHGSIAELETGEPRQARIDKAVNQATTARTRRSRG
jgi:transcriptional regulator with XRE-family HTH domain